MKRLTIYFAMCAFGYMALVLGSRAGVSLPKQPANVEDFLTQMLDSASRATWLITGLAILGSVVGVIAYTINYLSEQERVRTGNAVVFWTMVVFVLSCYAFGAFAQPLAGGLHPENWQWSWTQNQWNFVALVALIPPLMLLRLFVLELFSSILPKLDPYQAGMNRLSDELNAMQTAIERKIGSDVGTLATNLQTHRDAFGKRMTGVEENLAKLIKDLGENSVKIIAEIEKPKTTNLNPQLAEMIAKTATSLAEHRTADLEKLHAQLAELLELAKNQAVLEQLEAIRAALPALEARPFLPTPAVAEAPRAAA